MIVKFHEVKIPKFVVNYETNLSNLTCASRKCFNDFHSWSNFSIHTSIHCGENTDKLYCNFHLNYFRT